MTKNLLFNLISATEAAGYPVVAIVCDLGPTNQKLWKTLEITLEKTHFRNPAVNDRDIYVFADAPHLVKLIRNNFLDYGFQMANGNVVDSKCVRELVQESKSDLKVGCQKCTLMYMVHKG